MEWLQYISMTHLIFNSIKKKKEKRKTLEEQRIGHKLGTKKSI